LHSEREISVLKQLNAVFASHIPSGRAIATEAIADALNDQISDTAWIKENFSHLVESVQVRAYEKYLQYERQAWKRAFAEVIGPELRHRVEPEQIAEVISNHFYAFDRFFLSRTQSRRSRAGIAFETLLYELLRQLGYPFTFQPRIDGKPDFVFPSIEYYRENPPDAIVFTVKRSLRERWRQIVTEGSRGLGFYLATIDDRVSETAIAEMKSSRIHLIVPDRLKSDITRYSDGLNVISFEDFFMDHLDPKMTKWKRNRVIT
jgi:hypothetical protein